MPATRYRDAGLPSSPGRSATPSRKKPPPRKPPTPGTSGWGSDDSGWAKHPPSSNGAGQLYFLFSESDLPVVSNLTHSANHLCTAEITSGSDGQILLTRRVVR